MIGDDKKYNTSRLKWSCGVISISFFIEQVHLNKCQDIDTFMHP